MPLLVELLAPSRGNPSRATHHLFASLQKGGRPLANSLPGAARPARYSAAQQYSPRAHVLGSLALCVWNVYIRHLSDVLGALYLCTSCGRGVRICATLRSEPRLSSCRGNLANWASPLLLQNARKTRPCTQHPVFITKEFIVITLDNGVSILQTLFKSMIVQCATLPKLSSLSGLINLSLY